MKSITERLLDLAERDPELARRILDAGGSGVTVPCPAPVAQPTGPKMVYACSYCDKVDRPDGCDANPFSDFCVRSTHPRPAIQE